jgi:hypothetical protein
VRLRVVVVAATALALVACGGVRHGPNETLTPEPTSTPIPTSTPPAVVDALKSALLPESELGAEWSRIPSDPRVSRFVGDDESLRSPCDLRGPVPVTFVAGEHIAGPKDSSDLARPQWYETIAVFPSGRAILDYMRGLRLQCMAEGQSAERLFDRVGDATVYVQYGAPGQIHRVLLVRRRYVLMQIRYETYALTDADEHRFEGLVRAADDRVGALTGLFPDLGVSVTPTTAPSRLN